MFRWPPPPICGTASAVFLLSGISGYVLLRAIGRYLVFAINSGRQTSRLGLFSYR